jgi:hypothetical protein
MPERQCYKCERQKEWGCEAKRHPTTEAHPDAMQDKDGNWWFWSKPAEQQMVVDDELWLACPRQDLKERGPVWDQMLLYFGMYKKGFLPQQGAVMDQSNKAMEVFRIFENVNAECDDAQEARTAAAHDRARAFAMAPKRKVIDG